MADMQCPYCGADQDVCHDDGHGYDESVRHEHQCSECEKTFVFNTTIVFYYEPRKADCLNGSPHELSMSSTYPKRYSKMCCKHCDFERKPTSEEFNAAGIKVEEPTP